MSVGDALKRRRNGRSETSINAVIKGRYGNEQGWLSLQTKNDCKQIKIVDDLLGEEERVCSSKL
jgi:hypothetical protein